jgi:hypothetical protein
VSSFLYASNIFLIIILPDAPLTFPIRPGILLNTFAVLFQLKEFFTYSEKLLQSFLVIALENGCVVCWKLLWSGFRSVLVNAPHKPLRLKIRFASRGLVRIDLATCTFASGVNSFNFSKPSSPSTLCKEY